MAHQDPSLPSTHPWRWFCNHFEEAICAGLLLFMAGLAFANVLVRYLSNYSFAFSEELEVSLLVYLTLFGAAAAFRRGLHLGMSALQNRFPVPLRKAMVVFSSLLTIAVFAVLIYYGIFQIRDEMQLQTLSEALEIPQWIYTLALPFGSALIIVRVVQWAVEAWRAMEVPVDNPQ